MFDPTYTPTWGDIGAFQPWAQALIDESSTFDGPVYLLDGDSHVYNTDKPLATGSPWLTTYDVQGAADNLTRVTVDGSSNNNDWLRGHRRQAGVGEPPDLGARALQGLTQLHHRQLRDGARRSGIR